MEKALDFRFFSNHWTVFFSYSLIFLGNIKKENKKTIILTVSILLLCILYTCISTKELTKVKVVEKKEKFGVMDSVFKDSLAPNFPFFAKENSSNMEEELTNLFWQMPDFLSRIREEIDPGLNGFYWPTRIFVVTDTFGICRYSGKHKGIDIRIQDKVTWRISYIFAAEEGTVHKIGRHKNYGLYIDLFHVDVSGQEYYTRYAHLEKTKVREGRKIYKGERIAKGGNSGRSRGPHLHFEIFVVENGKKFEYNPLPFFSDFKNEICLFLPRKRYKPKELVSKVDTLENDTTIVFASSILDTTSLAFTVFDSVITNSTAELEDRILNF